MTESNCPMWDAYNNCCMWERMEKIYRYPRKDKQMADEIEECLAEMP